MEEPRTVDEDEVFMAEYSVLCERCEEVAARVESTLISWMDWSLRKSDDKKSGSESLIYALNRAVNPSTPKPQRRSDKPRRVECGWMEKSVRINFLKNLAQKRPQCSVEQVPVSSLYGSEMEGRSMAVRVCK